MIVISIIWIMMSLAYAPYNYFQKKAEVKIAAKEIAKTLSESRNMAVHWTNSGSWNLSIWVYFDTDNKNLIKIYWYPYDLWTWSQIVVNNDYLLNEIKIEPNIQIDKVEWKDKVLFLYSAISGEWNYFDFDFLKTNLTDIDSDNIINIEFSYKWATSWLNKMLKYYTKTYISDY